VQIDSQLYVNKARAFEYPNHVGTATVNGYLEGTTVHQPGDLAYFPPKIAFMPTVTNQGTGPLCTVASTGAEGAITIKQKSNTIDFQVIDLVVYPPEELTLYLDVGPADDYHDDTYRLTQCMQGKVVSDTSSPGTNLWEEMIFAAYPRGLRFTGTSIGSGSVAGVWNWFAKDTDWEGSLPFLVATWDTPQRCAGYCLESKSWLKMSILAFPRADP
jgi:hypothetical protein